MLEFVLTDSRIYSGVSHRCWLYIPAHYDGRASIPLMTFMDGNRYVGRDGCWRVPVVLDNLIAKGELPALAAVFIDPAPGDSLAATHSPDGRPYLDVSYRSLEYDTLDATYAEFLVEDVFPELRKHVRLTEDPEGRAVAGHSSGGLCAFTVAWQRPDQFRKVHCANGSFTDKRGAHVYPQMVRASPRKPIRIWQQSGEHDLAHPVWGDWSRANQAMAEALREKDYDHQFVFGQGSHAPAHAASLFPQAMRWLWRDYRVNAAA